MLLVVDGFQCLLVLSNSFEIPGQIWGYEHYELHAQPRCGGRTVIGYDVVHIPPSEQRHDWCDDKCGIATHEQDPSTAKPSSAVA